MTRVFLAAGVAAMAIAAPASAGPGGHGGGGGKDRQVQTVQRGGGGGQRAERVQRMAAPRAERVQQMAAPRIERAQRVAAFERPQRAERVQMRAERQQVRASRVQPAQERIAARQQVQVNRQAQMQNRLAQRQQVQANRQAQMQNRVAARDQMRANRQVQVQDRLAAREQMQAKRQAQVQDRIAARQQLQANRGGLIAMGQGYGVGGCPPGLAKKAVACVPPGQAAKLGLSPVVTAQTAAALRAARVDALNRDLGMRMLAPATAATLIGTPLNQAMALATLNPLPSTVSYLYPETPDYYYRYGNGYLYQVDRSTSLIDALLPLLGGGYMPGQYLPSSYMNSYVPNYYGLNSFYPSSYDYGYGSPYSNVCNRYVNGVIYQVDCVTGMIADVVPMYAGGYGVGQLLPSAYTTYNVPYDYRSMYYNTPDYGYYYAPGAIYQYDPSSSLITSVAALLSPGFSVGQQLPMGYDVYNVPYAYRATYYDTPTAMYRYNNGSIYQIDPTTMLVTAVVASLLHA